LICTKTKTGKEVDLSVKRYLQLKEPARANGEKPANSSQGSRAHNASQEFHGSAPEAAHISRLLADLDAQRNDIERIDNAGFKVVSALDEAVSKVEADLTKMKDTMSELRREIAGNHDDLVSLKSEVKDVKRLAQDQTVVNRLEKQLNAAKADIDGVRQELSPLTSGFQKDLDAVKSELRQSRNDIDDMKALLRDRISVRDHAKEMSAFRAELSQLRKQLDESRSKQPDPFPSRELNILTSNIAKIGSRASQVENLQMEFEILKGRVERIEHAGQSRPAVMKEPGDVSQYRQYNGDEYDAIEVVTERRKRSSLVLDDPSLSNSSSAKRTAFTSDPIDSPGTPSEWPANPTRSAPSLPGEKKASNRAGRTSITDRKPSRPARRSLIGISNDDKPHRAQRRG
jgi:DNA repair exonuclease SbcCD ATPase subunit